MASSDSSEMTPLRDDLDRSKSGYSSVQGDGGGRGWEVAASTSIISEHKTLKTAGAQRVKNEYMIMTFKPIFEEYEESGIPLRELRRRLEDSGLASHMPAGKVELVIRKADDDRDGHLDYEEFIRIVTTSDDRLMTKRELSAFQKSIRFAVSTVAPSSSVGKSGEPLVDDYMSHYNCKPPPLFMIIVSLVEVIVFIVYAVELKGTKYEITATSGLPLYSPLIYNPSRRYEAWRYLTYMMIHQGYLHLIFNLIFQLLLGLPLEMVHKWWRVGTVYCLGVIAGSMCHSVFDTGTLLAGASGGCYALIGAHFAIVVMNWKEMTYDWMEGPVRFILSAPVRLVVWTLFAGIDTGIAIWNRYHGDSSQNIGYAAHFGGALAGLLIGIPVLKNIHVKPWEKVVWWVALIGYLLCLIFAVCWNAFYPHYPDTDWRPCCPFPKW